MTTIETIGDGGRQTENHPLGMAFQTGEAVSIGQESDGSFWFWTHGIGEGGLAGEGDDMGPYSTFQAARIAALNAIERTGK